MCNILKSMKKEFSEFCDFISLRNGRFCAENSYKIEHNITINDIVKPFARVRIKCVSEDCKKMEKKKH